MLNRDGCLQMYGLTSISVLKFLDSSHIWNFYTTDLNAIKADLLFGISSSKCFHIWCSIDSSTSSNSICYATACSYASFFAVNHQLAHNDSCYLYSQLLSGSGRLGPCHASYRNFSMPRSFPQSVVHSSSSQIVVQMNFQANEVGLSLMPRLINIRLLDRFAAVP